MTAAGLYPPSASTGPVEHTTPIAPVSVPPTITGTITAGPALAVTPGDVREWGRTDAITGALRIDARATRAEILAAIDQLVRERDAAIGAAYRAHIGERDRLVALRGWGLSDRQAARVVAKWGELALETLREDPYQLGLEIDGFGWVRSDEVARAMGLPADHPSRIRAGLEHLLGEARQQGHVYVAAGKLISMGARLLGVPEEAVVREGRAAIAAGRMVRREAAGMGGSGEAVQRIYSPDLDAAEQAVADAVRRMTGRAAA